MAPIIAIYFLWVLWGLSWLLAAFWSARAVKRAGLANELGYRAVILIGFLLLFGAGMDRVDFFFHFRRTPNTIGWLLAGLTAAGFAFCWWARIHLGVLWSSAVTKKSSHRVVDTGPYRIVRHPIYTGIILAALATAVARGTLSGYAGFVIGTVGWYLKARLEERFLRAELGQQAYDSYAERTPMLVPFLHG